MNNKQKKFFSTLLLFTFSYYPSSLLSSEIDLLCTMPGHLECITAIEISPNNSNIISGSEDGTIIIWDYDNCSKVRYLSGHLDRVTAFAYSFDEKTIISSSKDKTIRIWENISGKRLNIFRENKNTINALAYFCDTSNIISKSIDGKIKIWDQAKGFLKTIKNTTQEIKSSICYSSNNWRFFSKNAFKHSKIQVNDIGTEFTIKSNRNKNIKAVSISYSKDLKLLATGTSDAKIIIWDLSNSNQKKVFSYFFDNFESNAHKVTSVAFSQGKEIVISGSGDGVLRVWNLTPYTTEFDNKINADFDNAKKLNTLDEYQKFISTYRSKVKIPNHKELIQNSMYKVAQLGNDWESCVKYLKNYPFGSKRYKVLKIAYKIAQNNGPIYIAQYYIDYTNSNDDDLAQELIEVLWDLQDIFIYSQVLKMLPENNIATTEIAADLVRLTYSKLVKPEQDIDATTNFIQEFSQNGPGDIVKEAYDDAVNLEKDRVIQLHDKLVNKSRLIPFLYKPSHDTEVASDSIEIKVREQIAHSLYIDARKSKESADDTTFAIKYDVLTDFNIFKHTRAVFDIYRDREMKELFEEVFDKMINSQKQANTEIVEQLTKIISSVEALDGSMGQLIDINSYSPTEEEIWKQNQQYLMQSHIFDKTHNKKE